MTLTILTDDRKDHNDFLIWQEIQRYEDKGLVLVISGRTDESFLRTLNSGEFVIQFNPFDQNEERNSNQSFIMRDRRVLRRNPTAIIIENLKEAFEQGLTKIDEARIRLAVEAGHDVVLDMPYSDDNSNAANKARAFVSELEKNVEDTTDVIHKRLN